VALGKIGRLDRFGNIARVDLEGEFNVVFVCTFEKDEPYQEVIQAAQMISPSITLYVKGNHRKIRLALAKQALVNPSVA
jgi:hypothetical protein